MGTAGIKKALIKDAKQNVKQYNGSFLVELGHGNDSFTAYIDKSCLGPGTEKPEATIRDVKWFLVREHVWLNYKQTYSELSPEDFFKKLTTEEDGTKIFEGNNLIVNASSIKRNGNGNIGVIYLLIPYTYFPESDGVEILRVVVLDKPQILYCHFKFPKEGGYIPLENNEKRAAYGQTVQVEVYTHLLPDCRNYAEKFVFDLELINRGNTVAKLEKQEILFAKEKGSFYYNPRKQLEFFIDPEWQKNHVDKKSDEKFYLKLKGYIGYSEPVYNTSDHVAATGEYDSEKATTDWTRLENGKWVYDNSRELLVPYDTMSELLSRFEVAKNDQIQYIGDIRYTQKGIDPCGYSTITIKDESDKDKDPLVIFDEDDIKSPIDRTSQIFGLIAGEERKNVSITLGNLTNKKVLCNGLLLEAGQKHDDVKRIFQIDRVMPALRDKDGMYVVVQDPEQAGDVDVVPDKKRGLSKDVSEVQQWQEGIDFKFEGEDKMILMLRYMYNKTAFEKIQNPDNKAVNNLMNDIWLFNYFLLTQDKAQIYFLPISTCRYPNQLAKINVYPDIEWLLSLKLSSTTPNVYSHTNMPSGVTHEIHQERALEAGNNRRWLNKEVSFELVLKATTGSVEKSIGVSYEEKITTLLKALIKVKETLDSICGVTSARSGMAAGIADRLPGFLGKSPITFQLDYPVITIEGGWKFGYNATTKNVEPQGKLAVAFTPLIKGTGKLDLIACAEFIPPAKPIIVAIRTATKAVGVDIWFNLYAFGQIDISYTFLFGAVDGTEPLNIATTVGVGAELGVKASAEVPKLSFGGDTTNDMDIGFEASARGETSIIISGKQGSTTEGIYVEPSLGFGGMVVFVTAKASVWKMGVGFEEKPYELIKPEPDLLKDRFYIIKANNDKK